MLKEKISYHKSADRFIRLYYENHAETNVFSGYRFISRLANEAKLIAKSIPLKEMDYQNAIVATWFRYAGVTNIGVACTGVMTGLLNDFFTETDYPFDDREVVEKALLAVVDMKTAETPVEEVVSDAVYSQLAFENLMEINILLKEEVNRLTNTNNTELYYSRYFFSLFVKTNYYTNYAVENYTANKKRNFQLLEKRIWKLEEKEKTEEKSSNGKVMLTNKETEDLFKIAFRNYNQLVSVADSKAGLLINVNSIIISVMLAFVIGRIERYIFLLWPTVLLLSVCTITILLSILASRPQKNSFVENEESHTYQKFFFGSFDLIDPRFRFANWEQYYSQLSDLFNNSREQVYIEIYKESFNVRKVLSKKFSFLAKAYWVFIVGLLLSIIAFVLSIRGQTFAS
jgi:hypothetical protein